MNSNNNLKDCKMRTLIILIIGAIFVLLNCKKDPEIKDQACKPINRPKIIDTVTKSNKRKIKHEWKLKNHINFKNSAFLNYKNLKKSLNTNDHAKIPKLEFQNNSKIVIVAPVNECWGKYHISKGDERMWLKIKSRKYDGIPCTIVGVPKEFEKWEKNYVKAVKNSTCFQIKKSKLSIQYYINKNKKGKLVYERN